MAPEDSYHIRSEEVEDIVTSPPKWIVRSGMMIIGFIFLSLISVSWFISYSDFVSGSTLITSSELSTTILAPSNNRIISIHFKDGGQVNKGDVLIKLENLVDTNSLKKLSEYIIEVNDWVKMDKFDTLSTKTFESNVLGDFQSDFNLLTTTIKNYNQYVQSSGYETKRNILSQEKSTLKSGHNYILKQKQINDRKLEIAFEKFNNEKKLYNSSAITKHDYMDEEMKYLMQEEQTNSINTSLSENKLRINRINNELNDLKIQHQQQILEYKNIISSQLNNLQNKMATYEKQCLVKAPVSGKAYFLTQIRPFENVQAGTPLVFIQPDSINYSGRIYLSSHNLGKVEIGQNINIYLNEFPQEEYGVLKGKVTNISELPKDSLYVVEYKLENGLTTTFQKPLKVRPEMKGKADIITRKKNLFQRFFERLYKFKSSS